MNLKSATRVATKLLAEVDRQFAASFKASKELFGADGYSHGYLQGQYDAAVNYVYTAVAKRMGVDRDQLENEVTNSKKEAA